MNAEESSKYYDLSVMAVFVVAVDVGVTVTVDADVV